MFENNILHRKSDVLFDFTADKSHHRTRDSTHDSIQRYILNHIRHIRVGA